MHQLALPQPADSSAVPISGLQEVTLATISAAQQFTEDNKWVSLMIDSGAATPVCPPWFITQFPLQHLEHGTGPQLRTVTNQHIKLHGYRWVCVTNHSGQPTVIPFYVCEVKQPILSVTGLVEQGFQVTLNDNPRLQRTKPTTTLTPEGPADTGYAGDYWQFDTQGELVRVHRQHRKTPSRTQCPVPEESDPRMAQRTRLRTVPNNKGETAFRIKKRHSNTRDTAATVCNKDTANKL